MTGPDLLALLDAFTPQPTDYFRHGAARIAKTMAFLPKGRGRVLELGCDSHFTLSLALTTDYEVVPQNSPRPIAAPENVDDPTVVFTGPETRSFTRVLFDVEADPYPFPDASFEGVLCCELIEHLLYDPAWMIREAWRVLRPNGWLLITTPNLASYHAIRRAVMGVHPLEHSLYFQPEKHGHLPIQHTREYVWTELTGMLEDLGFTVERAATFTLFPNERLGLLDRLWLVPALMCYNVGRFRHPKHLSWAMRHPHAFILARKAGARRRHVPRGVYLE